MRIGTTAAVAAMAEDMVAEEEDMAGEEDMAAECTVAGVTDVSLFGAGVFLPLIPPPCYPSSLSFFSYFL